MPPEEAHSLVAVRLDFVGDELQCHGERAFPKQGFIKVSWYTKPRSIPEDYEPILGGVVFAHKPSVAGISQFDDLGPTKRGDHYSWRDTAGTGGLMYVLVLPEDHTIANPQPMPVEAKKFEDRVAVFWLLYLPGESISASVTIEWSLGRLSQDLDSEIDIINREIFFASKRDRETDYDVALSFAGEDRAYVEQVARELRQAGVKVFYDEFEQDKLWGTNLYDHLSDVYKKRARFTVMFISRWYAEKRWTNFERQAAQARAFSESREYILPTRFDDTELPGMLSTTAYVHLRERSPSDLAGLIVKKLQSAPK
jgi:hypothetical protein